MLSLRSFMFERVYLGPQARGEHERAHGDDRAAIFDHLVDAAATVRRARSPTTSPGMTDRFALDVR